MEKFLTRPPMRDERLMSESESEQQDVCVCVYNMLYGSRRLKIQMQLSWVTGCRFFPISISVWCGER